MYHKAVTGHLQNLSQRGVFFDDAIEISISDESEIQHVNILSEHIKNLNGVDVEFRCGVSKLRKETTKQKIEEVLETCRPLYDMGDRVFQLRIKEKKLVCEILSS